MSAAVTDHKIATILKCMKAGLSPADTAVIFRKQAAIMNACCDEIIKEKHAQEKVSWGLLSTAQSSLPLVAGATIGLPVAASYMLGKAVGDTAASQLTPVNEVPISTYQKAEEILRMKQETADIISRVEKKKKENEEKSKDRSVRSLF